MSTREGSVVSKFPWIIAAALLVALPASAEIFKCVAKDGTALYQNFPCQIDSLGSLPSQPASAKALATPVESAQAKPKPAALEKSAMSVPSRPLPAEPRIGMTPEEVRAIWGEPTEIVQDEPPSGRVEIWEYGDGRSVQINNKQRVLSVKR
jgi:uncharacterized protein DUF4124